MRQGHARRGCELASQPASAASQQADLNIKHKTNEWCDGRVGRGGKKKKEGNLICNKAAILEQTAPSWLKIKTDPCKCVSSLYFFPLFLPLNSDCTSTFIFPP